MPEILKTRSNPLAAFGPQNHRHPHRHGLQNYDYPIIRIDTNQGVYGIGEVRDAGHRENALQFKSMLLGQNPCNVDMIFRAMKQFGNWGREGGGVSGMEIALWDLVGKVYGVPCYQFLGRQISRQGPHLRRYACAHRYHPGRLCGRVQGRKNQGLTFIKFDIGLHCWSSMPGTAIGAPDTL